MRVNCSEETKAHLKNTYNFETKKNVELKGKGQATTFIIKNQT
jgi:hypothetical protein